jgi:hypothetical protein
MSQPTTSRSDHPHAGGENTRFIIQVAALSWAATQVPEITAAIQSFLNVGFRSAAQVEFVVMIGVFIPLQRQPALRVSGILFLNMLLPVIVDATR